VRKITVFIAGVGAALGAGLIAWRRDPRIGSAFVNRTVNPWRDIRVARIVDDGGEGGTGLPVIDRERLPSKDLAGRPAARTWLRTWSRCCARLSNVIASLVVMCPRVTKSLAAYGCQSRWPFTAAKFALDLSSIERTLL
jgi:hypothetical protein